MTTWLITGCSSGLGQALAKAVLEAGFNAVVTARDTAKVRDLVASYPDTAIAVALDVTDPASVVAAIAQAEAKFGAVEVLANNAGYGYRAAVEEGDEGDVARLFATNLHGAVAMMKAVLPGMRSRKQGTIVNVSSIAAQGAAAGSGYYSATKMALEGVSDALRKEVGPLGIKVLIVEPGAFRTDFAGRSLTGATIEIADYADTVGPRRKGNDFSDGTQPGDPARAARTIVDMVGRADAPSRLLLGSDAVAMVREAVTMHLREIDDWQAVSQATDFPDKS